MAQAKSTLSIVANRIKPDSLVFSRSTAATRVNNIGQVELIPANELRLDFYPDSVGNTLGWLIEESSTNTLLDSQVLNTANWNTAGSASITINSSQSPDGTVNSNLLASSVNDDVHVAIKQSNQIYSSGNQYTISVYAKKSGVNFLEISNSLDSTNVTFSQSFNLSTGVLDTSTGTVTSYMSGHPAGWYRCQVTFTADANTGSDIYFKARTVSGVSTTTTHTSGAGIYLWGAQSEALSYATSYIPTTDTAGFRAADILYKDNTEKMWNWDVGVSIVVGAIPLNIGTNPIYDYAEMSNDPSQNYLSYMSNGTVSIKTNNAQQLGTQFFDTGLTNTTWNFVKNSLAVKTNSLDMAQNGEKATNLPYTNALMVPLNSGTGNYRISFFPSGSGWLQAFHIFSYELSSVELVNKSIRDATDPRTLQQTPMAVTDNSITVNKLADDAVTADKIADDAVTAASIADNTITSAKIGTDQINAGHIAAGAVGASQIANNSITSDHIGLDIIVATDLANNAIGVGELQDNAVVENKIATSAVTNTKIADSAVDGNKISLASEATGDVMYYDGTTWVRLPKGNVGHVLTQGTNIPSWAADSTNVSGVSLGGALGGTVGVATINANTIGDSQLLTTNSGTNGQILSYNAGNLKWISETATDVTGTALGGALGGTVGAATINANTIGTTQYQNLSIQLGHIQNDSVDSRVLKGDATVSANRAVTSTHIQDNAVTANHINSLVVDTGHIANDAINADKIADDGVVTNAITDLNVTTEKLAADAVTNAKLADNAVDEDNILSNAITENKIANNAITTIKIANNQISGSKIAMGNDVAGDILYYNGTDYTRLGAGTAGHVLTMNTGATAPEWAADADVSVGTFALGGGVLTGTVGNASIADGAITSAMLGVNVIVAEDIANNAISVAELQDNAVVNSKLADDAVDTAEIVDGAVTENKLADDAVTADKLASLSVVEGSIVNLSVTNTKIANAAITGSKIASSQISGTHISLGSDAAGDIMYHNGIDGYIRLPKGTSGEVLTMNSGATAPEWAADSDVNVGTFALGGSLGGTVNSATINANTIGDSQLLTTNSGTNGQVLSLNAAGALTWKDDTTIGDAAVGGDVTGTLSNIQVTWSGIPNNTITSAMIAPGVIVAQDIAANAVNGTHIELGSDATGDVMYYDGTNYVRLPKGTDGEVLTLASGVPSWAADSTNVTGTAVGGDLTGTVGNATIAANAIDGTHIALGSDAAGDTMYYDGTNYIRLAKGSAGQVLTMNSGATAPEWAADSTNVGNTAVGGMLTGTVSNASIGAGVVTPTMLAASGTASSSTYLRGDGQWATVTVTETDPTAVTMAIALG